MYTWYSNVKIIQQIHKWHTYHIHYFRYTTDYTFNNINRHVHCVHLVHLVTLLLPYTCRSCNLLPELISNRQCWWTLSRNTGNKYLPCVLIRWTGSPILQMYFVIVHNHRIHIFTFSLFILLETASNAQLFAFWDSKFLDCFCWTRIRGEFMSRVLVARGDRVLSLLPDTNLLLGNSCLGWGFLAGPFETLEGASKRNRCHQI